MGARLYAKHFTRLALLNPLKVASLSSFDEETSLERLSNFSEVLELEMTRARDGMVSLLPAPKTELLTLALEPAVSCGHTGAEVREGGMCFQRGQSPPLRGQLDSPRDPVFQWYSQD